MVASQRVEIKEEAETEDTKEKQTPVQKRGYSLESRTSRWKKVNECLFRLPKP